MRSRVRAKFSAGSGEQRDWISPSVTAGEGVSLVFLVFKFPKGGGRAARLDGRGRLGYHNGFTLFLANVGRPGLSEEFAHEFAEGLIGRPIALVINVILQIVEQFVRVGVAFGKVPRQGAMQNLIEPGVNFGVDLAEVGNGRDMMRSRDSSALWPLKIL